MGNEIIAIGTVTSDILPIYKLQDGSNVFGFEVSVERLSGTKDVIPCLVKDVYITDADLIIDKYDKVELLGEVRTRNVQDSDGVSHLDVYVWVYNIQKVSDNVQDFNQVDIDGTVCRKNDVRVKKYSKVSICDFILASSRNNNRPSYIPCIVWNKLAKEMSAKYSVGDDLHAIGRFQSRPYVKKLSNTEIEERVAYEVSINEIGVEYGKE